MLSAFRTCRNHGMDRFYLKYKGLYHCIKGCCMKLDSGSKKCRCAQQSIEYAPPAAKYLASDTLSVNPMIPDHMFISPLVIQLARIRMALSFSSISQPRLHQFQLALWPSSRGGLEDSKTPPTCKVWMILSQVMALPKKQCFETIEDLLVF